MDALLDAIRIAAADGATDDERRRGAVACRALAKALDGDLVGPAIMPSPVAPPTSLTTTETAQVPLATLSPNPFAGMTADQVLDLAISKLRAAVGDGAPAPLGQPFRVPLVPVPRHP